MESRFNASGLNRRTSPPAAPSGSQNGAGRLDDPRASMSTRTRTPRCRAWISASRNRSASDPAWKMYISRQTDTRAASMAEIISGKISSPVQSQVHWVLISAVGIDAQGRMRSADYQFRRPEPGTIPTTRPPAASPEKYFNVSRFQPSYPCAFQTELPGAVFRGRRFSRRGGPYEGGFDPVRRDGES